MVVNQVDEPLLSMLISLNESLPIVMAQLINSSNTCIITIENTDHWPANIFICQASSITFQRAINGCGYLSSFNYPDDYYHWIIKVSTRPGVAGIMNMLEPVLFEFREDGSFLVRARNDRKRPNENKKNRLELNTRLNPPVRKTFITGRKRI